MRKILIIIFTIVIGGLLLTDYNIQMRQRIAKNTTCEKDYSKIPSYWSTALAEAITKVNFYQKSGGNNATSFGFITDFHYGSNAKNSPALLINIIKECNIPYYFDGGDVITGRGYCTKESIIEVIKKQRKLFKSIENKCLRTEGNHDSAYSNLAEAYAQNINPNEFNKLFYRNSSKTTNLVFGNDGTYYYADDVAHKIRYIVLNCEDISAYSENPDGSVVNNKMWVHAFRQCQADWFADVALNVPSRSWSVVVCSHMPPTGSDIVLGGDMMLAILQAFKEKTTFSDIYAKGDYTVSKSVDYTNGGGDVIAWIAGHVHIDSIVKSDYADFPIITTLNDSIDVGTDSPKKKKGTTTEQAFDIFTINITTRTVNVTRVGAGSDRRFTY